jgi:hypothetical protein
LDLKVFSNKNDMKDLKKKTLLFLICITISTPLSLLNAQGCSDAGLCTIDAFKPDAGSTAQLTKNKLGLGFSVGAADYNISAYSGYLGYKRFLGQRISIDAKLTFLAQNGNDISVGGPGDIFTNINYQLSQAFSLTAGVKIPLSKADRELDGLPLPMDYQSSLGTFDLLAGIRYNSQKWQMALAVQIPLAQNENHFFPGLYDPLSPLFGIQATNEFERQADILFHISRAFDLSDKLTLTPGLLPIYHLSEDHFTDIDGVKQSIDGSEGMTLNATIYFDYKIGDSGSLEFNLGFPLVVRDVRPDGLTRSFVFGVGYNYTF